MGIKVIEHTEARTEEIAIICQYQERGDSHKPFIVARQNLIVPIDDQRVEFKDLDEIRDLRNILNEMIESVESMG